MIKRAKTLRGVPFSMGRMRVGCVTDFPGADVRAPAEDLDNENPSLVALGKNATGDPGRPANCLVKTKEKGQMFWPILLANFCWLIFVGQFVWPICVANFFPRATSEGFSLCRSSAGAGMFAPGRRGHAAAA